MRDVEKKTFRLRNGKTVTYVSHDMLAVGDYGGAGSVGAGNIRYLVERHGAERNAFPYSYDDEELTITPNAVVNIETGGWGSRTAWVLEKIWDAEDYEHLLFNYPALDDDTLTAVEQEWQDEALEDHKKDIIREASKVYEATVLGESEGDDLEERYGFEVVSGTLDELIREHGEWVYEYSNACLYNHDGFSLMLLCELEIAVQRAAYSDALAAQPQLPFAP